MKILGLSTIPLAFACGVLLCSGTAYAQAQDAQPSNTDAISPAAESIADQMVPAEAVLEKELDAKKAQPGQEFRVALTGAVHLKNGTELPRGTALVGTIVADHMQSDAKSTLALRFTQAQLKDGKAVPIQATIVGIAPPANSEAWDGSDGETPPNPWNGKSLQVDQVGALSGVDLHSRIAAENSGVFVSTRKDNMKLAARSQLSLAIGSQVGTAMSGGF
jgi:hypothetical protein